MYTSLAHTSTHRGTARLFFLFWNCLEIWKRRSKRLVSTSRIFNAGCLYLAGWENVLARDPDDAGVIDRWLRSRWCSPCSPPTPCGETSDHLAISVACIMLFSSLLNGVFSNPAQLAVLRFMRNRNQPCQHQKSPTELPREPARHCVFRISHMRVNHGETSADVRPKRTRDQTSVAYLPRCLYYPGQYQRKTSIIKWTMTLIRVWWRKVGRHKASAPRGWCASIQHVINNVFCIEALFHL